MRVYIYIYDILSICIYICMYVYVCSNMYICIYIYIFIAHVLVMSWLKVPIAFSLVMATSC